MLISSLFEPRGFVYRRRGFTRDPCSVEPLRSFTPARAVGPSAYPYGHPGRAQTRREPMFDTATRKGSQKRETEGIREKAKAGDVSRGETCSFHLLRIPQYILLDTYRPPNKEETCVTNRRRGHGVGAISRRQRRALYEIL